VGSLAEGEFVTHADFEPYADEKPKVIKALEKIQRQFEFTPLNETNKRIFEMAAHNEFGEAGFRVQVTWQEIYKENLPTGVFLPGIEVVGRNKRELETDHDRVKWGVVKGLADGQSGYIREDGSKHEEPKSKLILP
jgi:hypothetical protein